jgi:hypothetical protein
LHSSGFLATPSQDPKFLGSAWSVGGLGLTWLGNTPCYGNPN